MSDRETPSTSWAVWAWNAYREGRLVEAKPAVTVPDLSDPVTVHANMLRGTIAKPTVEQIIHLYGRDALMTALVSESEVVMPRHLYWTLRSYAVHDNDCKLNKPPHFDGPCSCGLTAALKNGEALLTEERK